VGSAVHRDDVMFSVTVESMPFARAPKPVAETALSKVDWQESIPFDITWGVIVLLSLLGVIFIVRPLIQASAATLAAPNSAPALERSAGAETLNEQAAEDALGAGEDSQPRPLLRQAEPEPIDERIEELLRQDPAKAALMIRHWLEEN